MITRKAAPPLAGPVALFFICAGPAAENTAVSDLQEIIAAERAAIPGLFNDVPSSVLLPP